MNYQRLDQFILPPGFRGRSAFIVQLWWLVQSTLFAWSPQFMYAWRRFLLRLFGSHIGEKVLIRPSVQVTYPWKLTIGNYSWIGDRVELYTLGEIKIGDHVVISQCSYLCTGSHDTTKPTFDIDARPITVHDQAWVATDVFIAPGVTIGHGCVVGSRSAVFHDLPAGKICYGSPAIPVKDRVVNK
ncbi:putative colanic acid biosynthesis acetyltransferase [Candidatus Villigracilis saccharophilus]|uniref:putative colanic acid biosynthesis acetyltransferase n=1 Tax=Candidatus Villigracilis saccharophilus TaxID=3140684 RepID=UPI0031ED5E1B